MAILHAWAASWRTSSRPIPEPPPVTTAILPAKSFMCRLLGFGLSLYPHIRASKRSSEQRDALLKTTRDMVLPTAMTRSYPQPLWYDASLGGWCQLGDGIDARAVQRGDPGIRCSGGGHRRC